MTLGHLKAGVTQAQAIADFNSIGAYLNKTYPKDDGKMAYGLASPTLYGDYLGRPVKAFMAGLMLLSGLILLAACANLGSLFAARAADRSREVALRLALGSSRKRILRGLFTEAILISVIGGAIGLAGSVVLLRALSAWQPIPRWPIHLSVNPDGNVYLVALLLALASGFLFGAIFVGVADQEGVTVGPGFVFDRFDDGCTEKIPDIGDDDANGSGLLGSEGTSGSIRGITTSMNDGKDPLACAWSDVFRSAESSGNGGDTEIELLSEVVESHDGERYGERDKPGA